MKLDFFMPVYDECSRHHVRVRASLEDTFDSLLRADFTDSRLVRALMLLRGYGRRHLAGTGTLSGNLRRNGFVELAVVPREEVVYGLAGRFWKARGDLVALASPLEFQAFQREGYAKTAWNISLAEEGPGLTRLCTETRILCFGAASRRRFRVYWFFVAPFSGLIRRALLRGIRRRAEALVRRRA